MANVEMMVENLEKASDGVSMARDDLRSALANADAVQGLVLLAIIGESTCLLNRIDSLLNAVQCED